MDKLLITAQLEALPDMDSPTGSMYRLDTGEIVNGGPDGGSVRWAGGLWAVCVRSGSVNGTHADLGDALHELLKQYMVKPVIVHALTHIDKMYKKQRDSILPTEGE